MADFSSLSDTDESAVDDLISQAEDLVALDHLSSLNLSSSHSSILPYHLESCFQNLKSFPPRMPPLPAPTSLGDRGLDRGEFCSKSELGEMSQCGTGCEQQLSELHEGKRECPKSELEKMGKPKGGRDCYSGSDSSGSRWEDAVFTPLKTNPVAEKGNPSAKLKRATLSGGLGFNSGLGRGSDFLPSPPRKGGCFWCLLNKSQTKNKDSDLDMAWGKHEMLPSDLCSFSAKEQRRVLKKAMKEQERLSKEAEKIVRIAKQASERML
ncbi:hypothetical protein MLD38_021330 [Melastoma candidum]|uniref:Uncharacterized protein n=1 Tax=Melastoma candidum TaxID=119954 RepID=A0ACB9QHL0_9MYRT|nr:hypothetical protein MLD38_021330 [Melastoma candidum]